MAEYENGVGARPLPYPLDDSEYSEYTENNAGTPVNITPDFFPYDEPDTEIDLHIRMSMSQFTAIASAIDIGCDIGYGERSYELWRTWTKSLIGVITAMNCDDVADCVESELSSGNQALINQLFETTIQNGFGNPNRINPTQTTVYDRNLVGALGTDIVPLENCNLDALWSGLRYGIVSRLDDSGRDLLEDLTAIPNVAERLTVFIDVIPVIGDLVEGLALQITEIIPDLLDLYNSHSSEEVLDEIACDLFGLVCSLCRYPTFEELFNYYNSHAISGIPSLTTATLQTIAEYVLDAATQPAGLTYHTIMVWELFVLNTQAAWNGLNGTQAIKDMALVGEDFMSDNWKDLCDDCGENYAVVTYDYTQSQGTSYKTGGYSTTNGTYIPGKGWRVDRIDATTGRVTMAQPIEPTWVVRSVAYKTDVDRTVYSNYAVTARPNPSSNTGSSGINMTLQTSDNLKVRCRDDIAGFSGFQEIAISIISPNPYQEIFLEKMTIIYTEPDVPSGAIPIANSSACEYYE